VTSPVWPAVNACLNATSGLLLLAGWLAIRRKAVAVHKACMLAACTVSATFLLSYVAYHSVFGSKRYAGPPALRTLYLGILTSHTLLAIVVVPLVVVTLRRALKGRFEEHRWWARRTLPIWFYVSVTGVVVYGMLYQL